MHHSKTTSIMNGLNLPMYSSSSSSILASFDTCVKNKILNMGQVVEHTSDGTLAIRFAISCISLSGPDNSWVSLGASFDFSSQTKQLRIEAHCSGLILPNIPLNIISVRRSSSAELSSHAIRPCKSFTKLVDTLWCLAEDLKAFGFG